MLRTMVMVTVLLVAAPACSAEQATEPAPDPTPTASTPAVDEPLPCVPGTEPFTGPAADEFGAEGVMAAYCMLADLAFEQEKTSLALPVPEQKPRDLDSVRALLSQEAAKRWPALVRARAQGASTSEIDGLTLHDVRRVPAGYQRADDGPYVFGTTIGPATAAVQGEALRLTFTLDTGLVLEERGDDSGRHSLLPVTRTGSYVLVPDGDGWLIDDWEATFEHGQVRLVS